MNNKPEKISIVIPTLNEAGNIKEILATIEREVRGPKEIIIVDGNSTDGTLEIVKDTNNCRLIIEPRRGYGLALRTGIAKARGDVVVMVDGDGTYELKHTNHLLDRMFQANAELCLATRMFDPNKAMGLRNFIGNKLITFCFNLFYKQTLSDTQSGFRAISRSAIEKVDLKETDMPFATEMLIQFAKKGFKIVEVPSTYKIRRYGKPKLQPFKAGTQIIATILKGLKQ